MRQRVSVRRSFTADVTTSGAAGGIETFLGIINLMNEVCPANGKDALGSQENQ
jgi:hypothetical protein